MNVPNPRSAVVVSGLESVCWVYILDACPSHLSTVCGFNHIAGLPFIAFPRFITYKTSDHKDEQGYYNMQGYVLWCYTAWIAHWCFVYVPMNGAHPLLHYGRVCLLIRAL